MQISMAVVLLGLVGANSVAERGIAAPSGQHAVLVDNIGTYGRKISTTAPLAQKFFDQGLRLVYGYYFPEAIASFEEAQQYDPDHPMLDWGLALAMGPNPTVGRIASPMTLTVMDEKQLRLHALMCLGQQQSSGPLSKACQSSTTMTGIRIGPFATRSISRQHDQFWTGTPMTSKPGSCMRTP